MIDTQAIRKKILDLALRGKLTEQLPEDGNASDLFLSIQKKKKELRSVGKIRSSKVLKDVCDNEITYSIPDNWKWVRIGNVIDEVIVPQRDKPAFSTNGSIPWCRIEDKDGLYLHGTKSNQYVSEETIRSMNLRVFPVGTVLSACSGASIGTIIINTVECCTNQTFNGLVCSCGLFNWYLLWFLKSAISELQKLGSGSAMAYISQDRIQNMVMPFPPLKEQIRIVDIINKLFTILDTIDTLQSQYQDNLATLKSKIIDAGIQGKLTEQLPEDGTAEELYQQIQQERKSQEASGKIKKEDLFPDIEDQSIPFSVPKTWLWTYLGNVSYIVRGGSPRPIKQYITHDTNGINWIKIGDVEKGGKYIYQTNERIIPEGEKKSRRVYPGDFLLTNSMSFGRPYISQIEGCIHDGWLLIRNLNGFDPDYLYYLLSSSYLYSQFTEKASGSTVDNLNIDKVKSAMIPLPPLAEQKRIVAKLEELLPLCE